MSRVAHPERADTMSNACACTMLNGDGSQTSDNLGTPRSTAHKRKGLRSTWMLLIAVFCHPLSRSPIGTTGSVPRRPIRGVSTRQSASRPGRPRGAAPGRGAPFASVRLSSSQNSTGSDGRCATSSHSRTTCRPVTSAFVLDPKGSTRSPRVNQRVAAGLNYCPQLVTVTSADDQSASVVDIVGCGCFNPLSTRWVRSYLPNRMRVC
jgi:hypothetical protein